MEFHEVFLAKSTIHLQPFSLKQTINDSLYTLHNGTKTILSQKDTDYVFSLFHVIDNYIVGHIDSELFMFDINNIEKEPRNISTENYDSFKVLKDRVLLFTEDVPVEIFLKENKVNDQSDNKDLLPYHIEDIVNLYINRKTTEEDFVETVIQTIVTDKGSQLIDLVIINRILEECPINNTLLKLQLLEHLQKQYPDLVTDSLFNHQTLYLCLPGHAHPSNLFGDNEMFQLCCNCISNCNVQTFLKVWRRSNFSLNAEDLKIMLSYIQQYIDDLNTCSEILTEPTFLASVHSSKDATLCCLLWLTGYLLNFEYTLEWPQNALHLIDIVQPELYRDLNDKINKPINVVSLVLKNKDLFDCQDFKEFQNFVLNLKDIGFMKEYFHINISYARYIDSTPQHWIHQIISSTSDIPKLNDMFDNEFKLFATARHLSIDQVISSYFDDRKHLKNLTNQKLRLLLGNIKSIELRTTTVLSMINFIDMDVELEAHILEIVSYQHVDDVKYTLQKLKLKKILNKHELLVQNYYTVSKTTVIAWIKYILKTQKSGRTDTPIRELISDCMDIISLLDYMDISKSSVFFTLLCNNLDDTVQYKELLSIAKVEKDEDFITALKDTVKLLEYKINHTDTHLSEVEIDCLGLTVNSLKYLEGKTNCINPKILNLLNQTNIKKAVGVENVTYYEYVYDKPAFSAKCNDTCVQSVAVGSYFEEKLSELSDKSCERAVETIKYVTNLLLSEEEAAKLLDTIKFIFYNKHNVTKQNLLDLLECAIKVLKHRKICNIVEEVNLVLGMMKYIDFIDTAIEQTDTTFIEEGIELDNKTCSELRRYIGGGRSQVPIIDGEESLVESVYNHGHIILSQLLLQLIMSKSMFSTTQDDANIAVVSEYNTNLCEKVLRCDSEDSYFGLYAMCQLDTETLIDIVQIIRRVNPESMEHITNMLLCYMEIHDEESYMVYLKRQRNLARWKEILKQENVEMDMSLFKGCEQSPEYQSYVLSLLVHVVKSDTITIEGILEFSEEICPQNNDIQVICDLILKHTIPEVVWNSTFYDKIDYALEYKSPAINVYDLISQVDSYNYEGIKHLLDKLKLHPDKNKNKRYTKYSNILSIIMNYSRNTKHGSLSECHEPESTSPHQNTRLPFHDIYKKAIEGKCWYMFEREVEANVGDLVEICKVLKLNSEYFYTSAIKNVGLKYTDENQLMRDGSYLLQHVETMSQIYKAGKWLSLKLQNDDYKDEMMKICLRALTELVQEQNSKQNQQLYSLYRYQYNLFRSNVYLKDYSLYNAEYEKITQPSLLIEELYSKHYTNPHVHTMIHSILEIWEECQYNIDLPAVKRHLVKNWLLHDKTSTEVVDNNFKKAVTVLQNFNNESVASVLLQVIYYQSRADITSYSQIRFILALLMTVTRDTIETQKSISELTEQLSTLVFINRLPRNIQFTSTMFKKSDKCNLVKSILSRYGFQYLDLCLDICLTYSQNMTNEIWYLLLDNIKSHTNMLYETLQLVPTTLDTQPYWKIISSLQSGGDKMRDMISDSRVVVPHSVFMASI